MKKFSFFLLAILLCANSLYSQKTKKAAKSETSSTKNSSDKKYEVKSGMVEYEHSEMMGMKTRSVLYFDDYGKIEVRETFMDGGMEMMGIKISSEKHDFSLEKGDGFIYTFSLKDISNGENQLKKEIMKMDIGKMQGMAGAFASMDMLKNMDYREEGEEKVAGVTGKKYSISLDKKGSGNRVYGVMYKNIPLKTTMMGMEIIAKKITLDVPFPKEKLILPKDYKIVDGDEMMEKMMNQMPKNNDDED